MSEAHGGEAHAGAGVKETAILHAGAPTGPSPSGSLAPRRSDAVRAPAAANIAMTSSTRGYALACGNNSTGALGIDMPGAVHIPVCMFV